MKLTATRLAAAVFLAMVSGLLIAQEPQAQKAAKALRYEDLERMALENNPTLKQAEARIRAVEGKLKQAGLYPNPSIGYTGAEISGGPIIRGGEHGLFVDQTIVLGGKLRKNREVFTQEVVEARAEAEAQRFSVLNNLRVLYYETLAAQRRLESRQKLVALAGEAVKTSLGLFNVGAADKPDLLAVEIEAQQAQLALLSAELEQVRVWQQMAALVGAADLGPATLAGDFDQSIPVLEREATLQAILRDSPVMKAAHAGVERAQAAVQFERSRRVPDLKVRGGLRNNRELLEAGLAPVGLEGFAEVGIEIPIFNRKQGNILAALAEVNFAEQEVRRSELLIRARFAAWFTRYETAQRMVEAYRKEVIPRAEQAYQMYLAKFKEMAAAYPQALIAQRTLFQASVDYVNAVENLWRAVVPLQGYLLMEGFGAPRSARETLGTAETSDGTERRR